MTESESIMQAAELADLTVIYHGNDEYSLKKAAQIILQTKNGLITMAFLSGYMAAKLEDV